VNDTARVLPFPNRGVAAPPPRRLLTLTEIRGLYGYSERFWRYQIAAGMPTHKWAGGSHRFDATEVERWMATR
jgi:hypothetical protein